MISNFLFRTSHSVVLAYLKGLSQTERFADLNANPAAIPFLKELDGTLLSDFNAQSSAVVEIMKEPVLQIPTDENEFQSALELFITHGNLNLVRQLLQIAGEKHLTFDLSRINVPPRFVEPIASILAKTQANTFDALESVEMLRTSWRPLALAALTNGDFIERYLNTGKLRKRTVLGLSSIIGTLTFNPAILLNLAMEALLSAEKPHRVSLTMTFLAVVLDSVGSADEGFVEQLIERLTEKISCLFPPVLARLFVVVSLT
jgi:hypothetical protein